MKKLFLPLLIIIIIGALLYSFFVGYYNRMVTLDEGVKTAWGQIEAQYQRRLDLVPNLVNTVQGFADQEQEVLIGVTEARARVGQLNVNPNNAESFSEFMAAQEGLSSALSRLLVVSENYPQLNSNQNFLDLQAQLEGTENRIATQRMRYNDTVREYNTYIRKFPNSIIASMNGFERANLFESMEGADVAPEVQFD